MISRGDFSFIVDEDVRRSLGLAMEVLDTLKLWKWLALYEMHNGSFVFDTDVDGNLKRIEDALFERGDVHSGASFAIVMNHMRIIARIGWEDYVIRNVDDLS